MKKVMFGLLTLILLSLPALSMAEIGDVENQLTASDVDEGDWFGKSVSISGDHAIVGSPGDEDYSGSAYIFKRTGNTWGKVNKLSASDGNASAFFGYSVSISGKHAIVGVPGDDDNGFNSGAAYIFEHTNGTWEEVAKLTASDGFARNWFGNSVSISGNCAIVGAMDDDGNGFRSGSAYVFERTWWGTWHEVAKLTASDGATDDQFGISVSISGKHAIVGAVLDDDNGAASGSAYVFERTWRGTWHEVAKLTASGGDAYDKFGYSVSISGYHAIVGAILDDDNGIETGSAYVFERKNGTWEEATKLTASDGDEGDKFGESVSISGYHAIVGASLDDDNGIESGSAYVFKRKNGTWREVAKLTASDGDEGDWFGYSVSISGYQAIVGAYGYGRPPNAESNYYGIGSAYVFSGYNEILRKFLRELFHRRLP